MVRTMLFICQVAACFQGFDEAEKKLVLFLVKKLLYSKIFTLKLKAYTDYKRYLKIVYFLIVIRIILEIPSAFPLTSEQIIIN